MEDVGLSPDLAVIDAIASSAMLIGEAELKKKVLRFNYTKKHLTNLSIFLLVETILEGISIIFLILNGIFLITLGYNSPLNSIFFLIFLLAQTSVIVTEISSISVKRKLSVLNRSLGEAWNHNKKAIQLDPTEVFMGIEPTIAEEFITLSQDAKSTGHILQALHYMIDGINHELILAGMKNTRGVGDKIVPSYIFSIVCAGIDTFLFVLWLFISFNVFNFEVFKTIGLGIGEFILAVGFLLTAFKFDVTRTKYIKDVTKKYTYLTKSKRM